MSVSPGSHWWSSGGCWEFSFSAICPLSSEGTSRSNSEYTKSSGGRKSRCRSWEQESLLKVREWFSFVSRAHFLQICLHLLHPLLWKWSLRFHCLFLSGVILFFAQDSFVFRRTHFSPPSSQPPSSEHLAFLFLILQGWGLWPCRSRRRSAAEGGERGEESLGEPCQAQAPGPLLWTKHWAQAWPGPCCWPEL